MLASARIQTERLTEESSATGWDDDTYGEEEKKMKGLVSLKACTAATQAARAAIEGRIVAVCC
jgi:hypothetical protein